MSNSSTPRPLAHEIDTLAMRQVPSLLPASWVERPVSNDYGIDIEVELFRKGRTEGNLLFLQVKGLMKSLPRDAEWSFQMKVNGLEYAAMFVVPVLLVVKSVYDDSDYCRFVWLQEYISVVLDHDRPQWRQQQTVTVKLPVENEFPGTDGIRRWRHIATAPRRSRELGRLTYLAHEFEFYRERYQLNPRSLDDLKHLDILLDEVFLLESLFGVEGWMWSRNLAETAIVAPRRMIKKFLAGTALTSEDLGLRQNLEDLDVDQNWLRESQFHAMLFTVGNQLNAIAATANNYELARLGWTSHGDHLF